MTEAPAIRIGDDDCAYLNGGLTFSTTPAVYKEMAALFQGAGTIGAIDLSGITSADSAGLALLLEFQAMSRQSAGKLRITNAPSDLLRLAQLCEALDLLNISGRNPQP